MENTPVKLRPPLPDWHGFEDNQVLTADLLNDTTRYLDAQTRLSRVDLVGVGVVTGLAVAADAGSLTVSRGFGLTSDGDLVGFAANQTFGKAAPFPDAQGRYDHFRVDGTLVPLWELLPADSPQPDALALTDFFAQHPASDLVAVLYAEQFLEKHEICRADRCDAAGQVFRNEPRLLLTTQAEAKRLTGDAGPLPELPPLATRRVKFSERITQFSGLAAAYAAAITPTLTDLTVALTAADGVLDALLSRYQAAHGSAFSGLTPGSGATLARQFADKANAVLPTHPVQYAYDALRDVAAAYNAFREAASNLNLSVLPSVETFPKHLLLGGLQPTAPDPFRTEFQPSAAQAGGGERLQTALGFYRRLQALVTTFDPTLTPETVTVTPSPGPGAPLGERAIPTYYRAADLVADWQAERRGPKPPVLSCHGASYSTRPEVLSPLDYDWPGADFYRIEGHLNRPFSAVKETLDALRREQDLPFDVIGVQIEEAPDTLQWVPPLHLPGLDWVLHTQKTHLAAQLNHLSDFNQELGQRLDETVTSPDVQPLADALGGRDELTRQHQDVRGLQTGFAGQAQTFRAALDNPDAGRLADFHAQLTPVAAQINLAAKPLVNASAAVHTPFDQLALHVSPALVDYLNDQRRQQETDARGRFFFSNFLGDNPALLHAGGVSRGGTFVLVYRQDGTVVADFSLAHAWQPPAVPFRPLPLPDLRPRVDFKPWLQFDRVQPKILFRKDFTELTQNLPTLVDSRVNPVKTDLLSQIGLVNTRFDSTLADVGTRIDGLHQNVDAKLEASRADLTARVSAVVGDVQGVNKRVDDQVQSFVANFQKTVDSTQKLADQYVNVIGKTAPQRVGIKDLGNGIGSFVADDGQEKIVLTPDMFSKYAKLATGQQLPAADTDVLKTGSTNIIRQRPDIFRINQ
jgi:hypothetical protein